MRKKLLIALTAGVALCGMIGLSACDSCGEESGHEHNYIGWKSDKVYHWYECKNADCDEKIKDKAAHLDTDNDGLCDECGYEVGVVSHVHDYSAEWVTDNTYHWHECQNSGCDQKVIDKDIHFDESNDGVCDECGTRVEAGASLHEHPLTFYPRNDATCVSNGNSSYYGCSTCNKIFLDARGTYEITDNKFIVIPMIPHDLTFTRASEPSCQKSGNTAYYSCNFCMKWFEDEEATFEITNKASVILPYRHTIIHMPYTPPTCIGDGYEEHYRCTVCEKLYEDEEATLEIEDKTSIVITERADHSYEGRTCAVCGKLKPTEGLKYVYLEESDSYEVSQGTTKDADIVIPEEYNGKPVTRIANQGFHEHDTERLLASITIPDSITHIGEEAFRGCGNLVTIDLPKNLDFIDRSVFFGCSKLMVVNINSNITAVGDDAFRNCHSLATINLPASVAHIGEAAFYRCTSLTDITIPAATTIIDDNAFQGCDNVTIYCEATQKPTDWKSEWNYRSGGQTVTDPVKTYCPVVWNCKYNDRADDGLIYATINSIKYTINSGFAMVIYQTNEMSGEVVIPSSINYKGDAYPVTTIAEKAFAGCTSLLSITIPESVTTVGINAFDGCSALTIYCKAKSKPDGWEESVNGKWNNNRWPVVWDCDNNDIASDSYKYIITDGLKFKLSGLDTNETATVDRQAANLSGSIVVPAFITYNKVRYMVTGVNALAFKNCTAITEMTFSGVYFIGVESFADCISLTKITLAGTLQSIASNAFRGCVSLTDITFKGTSEKWKTLSLGAGWNANTGYHTIHCTDDVDLIKVKTVSLNKTNIEIQIDQTANLTATVQPAAAYNKKIIWSSSNENVATVSKEGVVTGIKRGSATVTVTSEDGSITASCTVNVGEFKFGSVSLVGASGYSISGVKAFVTGDIEIPDSYNGLPILEIASSAFADCSTLTSISIPKSVVSIGESAFDGCTSLTYIDFKGTRAEWNNMQRRVGWDNNTGSYTVHCTDGYIT